MDTLLNKRIPYVNLALIGLNLAYFIFLEAVGSTEDTALMIKYGAVYPVLVVEYRQYWRLLAACFMHFGAAHLCNNMLILFLLGDNLERALKQSTEDEAYKKGVEMIMTRFCTTLEKLGVTEIECLGQKFDPEMHNAVMHVEDEEKGENEIVEVFQKGFKLGDKVIRFAMVKVAN